MPLRLRLKIGKEFVDSVLDAPVEFGADIRGCSYVGVERIVAAAILDVVITAEIAAAKKDKL